MRINSNLGAAALGALIVSVALPALAAGKYFAKAERRANVAINGVILTGPCGRADLVRQCPSRVKI